MGNLWAIKYFFYKSHESVKHRQMQHRFHIILKLRTRYSAEGRNTSLTGTVLCCCSIGKDSKSSLVSVLNENSTMR